MVLGCLRGLSLGLLKGSELAVEFLGAFCVSGESSGSRFRVFGIRV